MTVVSHFMLAMLTHPHVLHRAQLEMDSIVGPSRLPTFSDRPHLPYLENIMSEVLRWGVPVPLGLPHRLMEDDVYRGMVIPKGTLVFANIWNMLRDEELYPNAEAFNPDRYDEPAPKHLNLSGEEEREWRKRRDPRNVVFGFGRRVCPGAHLIEESLWVVMAGMVATLDLKWCRDVRGREVRERVTFDNSVFRCVFSSFLSRELLFPLFSLFD